MHRHARPDGCDPIFQKQRLFPELPRKAALTLPLVQSGLYSVTQIADMVGFSNPSRFAAAFRKQFGCNPGEYSARN